jgi:Fe2+ transport system protein FeoA
MALFTKVRYIGSADSTVATQRIRKVMRKKLQEHGWLPFHSVDIVRKELNGNDPTIAEYDIEVHGTFESLRSRADK